MSLPLHGCRILIVEDDYFQADDAHERLTAAGAEIVLMTSSLLQAREALERGLDVALLDIDLFGETSFVLARELMAHGTKVVFVTGFERDVVPADLSDAPMFLKPVSWRRLISWLSR